MLTGVHPEMRIFVQDQGMRKNNRRQILGKKTIYE
jgi:hypothetical protein